MVTKSQYVLSIGDISQNILTLDQPALSCCKIPCFFYQIAISKLVASYEIYTIISGILAKQHGEHPSVHHNYLAWLHLDHLNFLCDKMHHLET